MNEPAQGSLLEHSAATGARVLALRAVERAFVQGGYGDGIDFESFCADVVNGVEAIIERHPGERVAVVCHGGVINIWTAHVLGMPMRLFFQPDYASIHRYVAARSGERSIDALNERARA